MDLRQLTHFVTIAEERQFTRAARRLHVVQSTLSASIRGLEREFGTALLIRNSRQADLTAAGRALLPAARRALAAADDARLVVDEVRGLLRGTLAIGVMHVLGLIDLPALLARYHEKYPGVSLTLRHSAVDDLVSETADGDLDLAFVSHPFDPGRVDAHVLGSECLVLAVRDDDPLAGKRAVALTDLADRAFVAPQKGFAVRARIDAACAAAGLNRRISCETDILSDLVDLVRSGLGIAFAPPSTVQGTDLVVVRTEPAIRGELVVVTAAGRPSSPAAGAFLDMLREAC